MRNDFPFVTEREPINQMEVPDEERDGESGEERAPRVDRGLDKVNLVIRAEICETEVMFDEGSKHKAQECAANPEETSDDGDEAVDSFNP